MLVAGDEGGERGGFLLGDGDGLGSGQRCALGGEGVEEDFASGVVAGVGAGLVDAGVVVGGLVVGGDVEGGGVAGAAGQDVEGFAGGAVGDEGVGGVDGAALDAVGVAGVQQLDVGGDVCGGASGVSGALSGDKGCFVKTGCASADVGEADDFFFVFFAAVFHAL